MTPTIVASQAVAAPQTIVEPQAAPQAQPKVVHPDEGHVMQAFGDTVRAIVTAEDTNGQLFVGEGTGQPQGGPPLHVHTHEDELFIIQQGVFEFTVAGAVTQAGPGTVVYGPRHIPHTWRVVSEEPGLTYVLTMPGSFGRFFERCAEQFVNGAPDMAEIGRISDEHGIIFLSPEQAAAYSLVEEATARPKIVRADEGVRTAFPGERARMIISSEDTNGQFTLGEVEVDPDCGPPPHVHTREDETFFVQSGRIEYWIDGKRIEAGPGTVVFAPRNIPHAFRGISDEPARALVMITPGGFEQFFKRYAELRSTEQADLQQIVALAAEYGLSFLPPAQ